MVPNTAHILGFALCELWSRTYTIQLQLRTFRLQYSTERICAAIGDISTTPCVLYCKFGDKYSADPPVYAMWTVVTDIYNVITVTYIQASIFNWTCLRCYSRYSDISMRVILQIWCQIERTSSGLRCVNSGPVHIQCNYSSAYSRFNIQVNVSALLLVIYRQRNAHYTAIMVQIQRTSSNLRYPNCGPGHIWCIYSSAYSGFNIQLNVSALLLEISGQCNALCELWSPPYTM
jgi:hypothetical protein